ncbi:MAG: ATP phosphoribosyltransferase [Candidatus Sumerlaeota bacterium]|nr:ATP phosphoribosyltransferase [Candidatus Sumerlaeota bacterium]
MRNLVWLAVADGHQQKHACAFLKSCGVKIAGYEGADVNRRPASNLDGFAIKVIRPQDMPVQVANGHFDLAITGDDWLVDHRYQFPRTPVKKLLNLGFAGVRVCAVVHNDLGVRTVDEFTVRFSGGGLPFPFIRIASEYVNIADHFACNHRFRRYKVIPTTGSTEAYLPEDADMIIENSETGRTLIENNLSIIEVLFRSAACLIANTASLRDGRKKRRIKDFISMCEGVLKNEKTQEAVS